MSRQRLLRLLSGENNIYNSPGSPKILSSEFKSRLPVQFQPMLIHPQSQIADVQIARADVWV